jgi:pimeloyl-ACP methyl ester carboxylesterase
MSRRGRIAVAVLLVVLLLYLLVCAAAYLAQERLLFPAPAARAAFPAGAERLALAAPDGVRLAGLRLPATAPDPGAPLILAFGGNGSYADDAAGILHDLFPASDVVAFHYRGYPPSGGRPSTKAIQADSLRAFDAATRRFAGRRIVVVGFSIGSGFAAHVAAHRPVAGLILVTPFDSLTKVAAAHLPYLPVKLLFRNPLEPAAELRALRTPTAILAAADDSLVQRERTDALRRAVPRLVYDRTIAHADHNSIYDRPEFRRALPAAVAAVLVSGP